MRSRAAAFTNGDAATVCKLHVTFAGAFVAANGEDVFTGAVAGYMEFKRAAQRRKLSLCGLREKTLEQMGKAVAPALDARDGCARDFALRTERVTDAMHAKGLRLPRRIGTDGDENGAQRSRPEQRGRSAGPLVFGGDDGVPNDASLPRVGRKARRCACPLG